MIFNLTIIIVINRDFVKDKVKRENENLKNKKTYKRNFNKARNKGKRKNDPNLDDYI